MFLKQLKLSGFKSFTEPTVIPLAKSLIGVVGPNGCGKSNLIDAVRWVMGESSAKSLRGESMTDVIFNGSTTRKPQGQASVELLFDNSLGRLVGQYAAYQDIAVKRVVSRDGDSAYFLNGTRCRRRDITDLFLGTGAGVRGYAIIGQGTISRLIEARPDELRVYLEEAAGISKYKDRRKETCQRIAHTRENLARLADICIELDNHLQRLDGQARIAAQYHTLKQEEQHVKAIILILKQRACMIEKNQCSKNILIMSRAVEQHQLLAAQAWQKSIQLKEQWHQDNEALHTDQTTFYELKTDIARLEEMLKQTDRDKKRLQEESERIKIEQLQITESLHHAQQKSQESEREKAPLLEIQETSVVALAQSVEEKNNIDQQLESAMMAFMSNQTLLQQAHHAQTHAAFELKHHQQRIQELQLQIERLDKEYAERRDLPIENDFDVYETALIHIQNELTHIDQRIEQGHASKNELRSRIHDLQQKIQNLQSDIRKMMTQMASLQATIDTVLGKQTEGSDLTMLTCQNAQRIAACLRVEAPWQAAVEMVMGHAIRGFVVEDLGDILPDMPEVPEHDLVLTQVSAHSFSPSMPRLLDYITGDIPALPMNLHHIYAAGNLNEALAMRDELALDESVLTPDGYWLSRHWCFSKNFKAQKTVNILAKQEELRTLTEACQTAERSLEQIQIQYVVLQEALQNQDTLLDDLQKNRSAQRTLQHEQTVILAQKKEKTDQHALRLRHIEQSREAAWDTLDNLHEQHEELMLKSNAADSHFASQQVIVTTLEADVNQLKASATCANQRLETVKQEMQTNQMALQKLTLYLEQYQRDSMLFQQRIDAMNVRLETIQSTLESCQNQEMPTQNALYEKMALIANLDSQIREQQMSLQACHQCIEAQEKCHQDEEKKAKQIFEKQQKSMIEEQVLEDRNRHFEETLQDMPVDIINPLREQTFEFDLDYYLDKNIKIIEKIEKLGAVNLSAIEEFERESARKSQLDIQSQDLQDALTLLEAAIDKIDQETQQRFGGTFEAVNEQFKSLFPKLFGGGRAELSLSCDNLLEAGILVTAQPPGKRNASIHLLSGGEKAMTAVALIFAIFQLNPSPFCMLDEVDAPLDDVNISRFCELVKEMSGVVQFLFITHNKVAMTLAEQLIGVTMREAGVSRIVTVDVEEAVELCNSDKRI